MKHFSLYIIIVTWVFALLCACGCSNEKTEGEHLEVDSLNMQAYNQRFASITTSLQCANQALAKAANYPDGHNEALCQKGFTLFMDMDYNAATDCFNKVLKHSDNELLKAMADVGMMKICQRCAWNKEFYDHFNSAIARMNRIFTDQDDMDDRQRWLWGFVQSEFHITSCIYFFYLRQTDNAIYEIESVNNQTDFLATDYVQRANYNYMIGSGGLTVGYSENETDSIEIYHLMETLGIARRMNLTFYEANAVQSLAYKFIMSDKPYTTVKNILKKQFGVTNMADDSITVFLAEKAHELFAEYGSLYQVSDSYLTISEYYMSKEQYDSALVYGQKALECVNRYHNRFCVSAKKEGVVPAPTDSLSSNKGSLNGFEIPELVIKDDEWINDPSVMTVPEMMAAIRELLARAYSALDNQQAAIYNRDIYQSIMEVTRQDRMNEQRYDELNKMQSRLDIQLVLSLVTFILLVGGIVIASKRLKQRNSRESEALMNALNSSLSNLGAEENGADILPVMKQWHEDVRTQQDELDEQMEMIEAERYTHRRRLEENKRAYIDKRTCLSIVYGIPPFLDRAVNEVHKHGNIQYLNELIDKINEYNEVLAHWIKIRQGMVSLNISNFALAPLMETLGKNRTAFEQKEITLNIGQTDAVVKADKALTLFMMNTLLENARKYTHKGGKVCLEATTTDEYVEICVSDTGRGISAEDISTILDEKVYDSSLIGDTANDSDLKRNKGFGFGLMNCKGIIEKYRKSNSIFRVCQFNIESSLGKGSRFSFRLPKGVMRHLCIVLCCLTALLSFSSCSDTDDAKTTYEEYETNMQNVRENERIQTAYAYVDSMRMCNVSGNYMQALRHADIALSLVNEYTMQSDSTGMYLLQLTGSSDQQPEIDMWTYGIYHDYDLILNIRNEAAKAAMALRLWQIYDYNNNLVIQLYKTRGQDTMLEYYSHSIKKSNRMKTTGIIVIVLIAALGLLIYYMVFYRHNMNHMFNLRQLVQFVNKLFATDKQKDLMQIIHTSINDIHPINMMGLLHNGQEQWKGDSPFHEFLAVQMQQTLDSNNPASGLGGKLLTFPLIVSNNESETSIGVLGIAIHGSALTHKEIEVIEILVRYVAKYLYYSQSEPDAMLQKIELKRDEMSRVEYEENNLHVHNMVLDNCLSTIKHETMYYPNRIKQLAATEDFDQMNELINYYKDVFTLLAECAGRQLENVQFRRKSIEVSQLAAYVQRTFNKQQKKTGIPLRLTIGQTEANAGLLKVRGDELMLQYMLDNLLAAAFENKNEGEIRFDFAGCDKFIKFAFADSRLHLTSEQMSSLFYADSMRYDERDERLYGSQYLVCKQIIREHDDHAGLRGCRIYAQTDEKSNGTAIVWTVARNNS